MFGYCFVVMGGGVCVLDVDLVICVGMVDDGLLVCKCYDVVDVWVGEKIVVENEKLLGCFGGFGCVIYVFN